MKYTKLVIDIIIFYFKLMFNIKLNYYDLRIKDMLEEYDFLLDYRKEWKKRKD